MAALGVPGHDCHGAAQTAAEGKMKNLLGEALAVQLRIAAERPAAWRPHASHRSAVHSAGVPQCFGSAGAAVVISSA